MSIEGLTERQEQLLCIVIQEHVQTAQPIGSNRIAENHPIGVSSATIRKDMAALEQAGLLTHPHTSAGRIPTDAGYRYYVTRLSPVAELPVAERHQIRVAFHQASHDIEQWLRLSTSVLARATQSAALATAPRMSVSRYKHLELVAIHGIRIMMILVLQEGVVKQQMLDLDRPVQQEELSRTSNELNDKLAGMKRSEIREHAAALSPFAMQVAEAAAENMGWLDHQTSTQIYRDGLLQILDAPEFAGGDNVRRIVHVLEEQTILGQVVDEYGDMDDVHVVIAGDGRFAELHDISLVLGRYGVVERATGTLGVIGPLRMSYGRTMGAVRFVAAVMSEMVEEMVGSEPTGPSRE